MAEKRHRIEPTMSSSQAIAALSDNKPAVIALLTRIRTEMSNDLDFWILLSKFDSFGLYGSSLFKTYCIYCNVAHTFDKHSIDRFCNFIMTLENHIDKIVEMRNNNLI